MRILISILVALAALAVSVSAAYYSITGLGSLFAGATTSVIIMASALEFSKLIIASVLYRFWEELKKFLKIYLSIALAVLVVITSMGIYGYLSSAYQETSAKVGIVDEKLKQVVVKKESADGRLNLLIAQKQQITKSIGDLQYGLSNNQVQYKDKDGNILTSTSSATRKSLENQLGDLQVKEEFIDIQMEELLKTVDSLSVEELNLKTELISEGEVGSLKYIANVTGMELDSIVNYLILLLVFVFDPLALSLVTVFNVITAPRKNKQEEQRSPSNVESKEIKEISTEVKKVEEIKREEPKKEIKVKQDTTPIKGIKLSDIVKIVRKSPTLTEVLLKSGDTARISTEEFNRLRDPKDETNIIQYM